ncbi:hypothetical protein [Autumnicola psychrophila]|uniref:Uncharacterized protein n=1 Tax=Autumnicola psychrophila TaxID=3075592 RepID=A0ABU3DN24_9FLAO|nr:hypothetical protein [Zunongwangia sp. F225]MDT0685086.1 hypothetical protein [Zunongwangia sp. F225]
MKKPINYKLAFGFLIFGPILFAQEIRLNIHKTSLKQYLQIEKNLDSYRIPVASNSVAFNGQARPIEFIREEKIIPNLFSRYHFKAKDSTMMSVHYDWDEGYPGRVGMHSSKKEAVRRAMVEKFHNLKNKLIQIYGEPIEEVEEEFSNPKWVNPNNILQKIEKWYPNDSTEIELMTRLYKPRSRDTSKQNQEIHLSIRNSKIETTKASLVHLISLSLDFLHSLNNKDITRSREFFSDSINNNLTDEHLNTLIDKVDFKIESMKTSARHLEMAGQEFAVFELKYKNESSSAPDKMIEIMFNGKKEIVGIRQTGRK